MSTFRKRVQNCVYRNFRRSDPDLVEIMASLAKAKERYIMYHQAPTNTEPEPPSALEHSVVADSLEEINVPDHISSHLPAATVSVYALVASNLPSGLSDTSDIRRPLWCFTRQDPCWVIDELFETPLPPRAWLDTLRENLSQMRRYGMRSIMPPSSLDQNLLFPLWVVSFWSTAVEVAEQRDMWIAIEDWVLRAIQEPSIREFRTLLENVHWDLRLWSLQGPDKETRIGHLAGLLSDQWLDERHIGTISSYLNDRVQREPVLRPKSWVAGLDLQFYLLGNARATERTILDNDGLRTYTQKIYTHQYSPVFVPVHVGGDHWILFFVDFENQKFGYGEFV